MAKAKEKKKDKRQNRETNQAVVRQSMIRRLPRRLGAKGQMALPAAPSLLDHYHELLTEAFGALGRVFNEEENAHLRKVLAEKLEEAFRTSPYSRVIVSYETDEPPRTSLTWRMAVNVSTVATEYEGWVKSREPPYFGVHPDAKILECARSLGAPKDVPVLDIGAGTGRNTLPLAREGFPTDAVELAPALAAILRGDVEKEKLPVRVIEGDALSGTLEIPERHYRVVCLAEVIASHIRSVEHVHALFETAAEALSAGGLFVFNAFLAKEGYRPDAMARELSQVFWSNVFTKIDIENAMRGLPFEPVSDESTHDFEHEHQPAEGWPPTGWFVNWAKGLDVYDLPLGRAPVELRWLVYRRVG
ncbi:MAG TPA: class I SAM-dependent methyltransferase [Polyangiaceae bacterium]|nr:class I SAM-dependent methyltransferase [Polyangiaceae bacterium]